MTDPQAGQIYISADKKIRIYIDGFTRISDDFALVSVSICPADSSEDMGAVSDEIEIDDWHVFCSRLNLRVESTPAIK